MSKRVLIAAGLVAALAGSGLVVAQTQPGPGGPGFGQRRGPGGPGGPRGFAGDLGLRAIELSEAQREQVRTIMESHQEEFRQAATRLREAHRALAEASRADSFNEATVRARGTDVGNAIAEEAILRAKVRAEVSNILTPEQQQQLKQRETGRGDRAKQRVQRRRG